MANYVHYVFAETPTEGNPKPLKGAGVTNLFDEMTAPQGCTLLQVQSLAGRTAPWGYWQGTPRQVFNETTLQFEQEDISLWAPTYLMHYVDGEYVVEQTEPPCITRLNARSQITASLTIT